MINGRIPTVRKHFTHILVLYWWIESASPLAAGAWCGGMFRIPALELAKQSAGFCEAFYPSCDRRLRGLGGAKLPHLAWHAPVSFAPPSVIHITRGGRSINLGNVCNTWTELCRAESLLLPCLLLSFHNLLIIFSSHCEGSTMTTINVS